jgi:Domain of unknown function (DUF222)
MVDDIAASLGERHLALLEAIRKAESTGSWLDDYGLDRFPQWVAQRCDITVYKARRWIVAAKALEHLPLTREALRGGRLGIDKVVELTRYATPDKEERQIRVAMREKVRDVKARGDKASAASIDDVQTAERSRHISKHLSIDGLVMTIVHHLPALDGELVWATLAALAESLEPSPEDGTEDDPEESLGQRMSDALVMKVLGGEDCDTASPNLTVHADLGALKNEQVSGELEGGTILHPALVQAIACDSNLQVVMEDEGTAVAASSDAYSPPRWMRRQLMHRDRGCTFPGCECTLGLQPHHITPYPAGRTSVDNLVTLCWRHHKMVHVFGWRVALGSGPQDFPSIDWYRPDGRRFEPGPDPPI